MPPRPKLSKTDHATIGKIDDLAGTVVSQIERGQDPFVNVPIRTLANSRWNQSRAIIEMGSAKAKRNFFNVGIAKKFMQTLLVASECKELIADDEPIAIRMLYYRTKHTIEGTRENTFEEQEESDPIIEDLEVTIDALREELKLFAEQRGGMVGPMIIEDSGDTINLAALGSGGWAVPSIVEEDVIKWKKKDCQAKFILLVEKGTVWSLLNRQKFWDHHQCMLVHGNGMPPRGVRRLLYRMHHELGLPVYVFVDNDPWGYYIYSVVRQGSINLAYESTRMAVPAARYLGLSSFDRERFKLPDNVTIKLDQTDETRSKQILAYPWFQKKKAFQKEIQHMLKSGVKLELEALMHHDVTFMAKKYLPDKLKEGGLW
ncbi:MAG: DNA topoisomerase IV subunit A [Planctomycetes bacterium]|nr:DNA topoisomerase IV subunit A [Planctomycetota bacterium]